jgi:metal-responsive CopG/Arc/MetJ family transcriptional regulator
MADQKSADALNIMATRKVRITLSLSSDILKEVDRRAAVEKVSRSAYTEAVLRQYLRDRERLAHVGTD